MAAGEFDSLYKCFGGEDWELFRAIALQESRENPWAIGDGGDAVGLFQQHASFWVDFGSTVAEDRWHPAAQLRALRNFWHTYSNETLEERLLRYHYRGKSNAPIDGDPDDYVAKVQAHL